MLVIPLSLFLCLGSASAIAISDDIAAVAGLHLAGQQDDAAIERELSDYLDQDDIAGATALVDRLAVLGEIDEEQQRALEDLIWRTKTERTLDYARKIREAIRNADLGMMRDYNARMQRLTGGPGSAQAEVVEGEADKTAPEPSDVGAAEPLPAEAKASTPPLDLPDEAAPDESKTDVIAGLQRRGEAAIAAFNLTIASPDKDSALGMVDELLTHGDEGKTAAQVLGRKIMARYEALIERDIGRGRLDKAEIFAERMDEVAKHAGLPRDQIAALSVRIGRASADRQEHDRLVREGERLRSQGRLVAPRGEHALAFAAEALKLDADPAVARNLFDDIVLRQRLRADRLAETGRLRDAARELDALADAIFVADVDQSALIADVRAEAAGLFRRADRRDSERERRAAAAARHSSGASVESDEAGSPFTFINPF